LLALCDKGGTSLGADGPGNTTSMLQLGVCGIDNGIDLLLGNIAFQQSNSLASRSLHLGLLCVVLGPVLSKRVGNVVQVFEGSFLGRLNVAFEKTKKKKKVKKQNENNGGMKNLTSKRAP